MTCKNGDGNPIENQDTGLCASCGLEYRRGLKRMAKDVLKKKPIRKVSVKMRKELKTFEQKKAAHLEKHPDCQARIIGCNNDRKTNTVHHCGKRGKNLNNEETFLTVCANCHYDIEFVMSAKERRIKGFLI